MAVESPAPQKNGNGELSQETLFVWEHLEDTAVLYERYLALSKIGQFPLPEDTQAEEQAPETGLPLTLEIHTQA